MTLNRSNALMRAKQFGAGLALSALSFVAAASTDPSTQIVAEIDKGKGYGIAAAVAFAIAVWAIRGVAMARRKG